GGAGHQPASDAATDHLVVRPAGPDPLYPPKEGADAWRVAVAGRLPALGQPGRLVLAGAVDHSPVCAGWIAAEGGEARCPGGRCHSSPSRRRLLARARTASATGPARCRAGSEHPGLPAQSLSHSRLHPARAVRLLQRQRYAERGPAVSGSVSLALGESLL